MTEKELSKVYWLKKEQQDIEERLKEVKQMLDGVGAIEYKQDTSKTNKIFNQIEEAIIKKNELESLLIENRLSILEEYIKIESYINTIEIPEIRLIARYRFLDLKGWGEIGKLLHSDRTTVSKKIRKYLSEEKFPTIPIQSMLK